MYLLRAEDQKSICRHIGKSKGLTAKAHYCAVLETEVAQRFEKLLASCTKSERIILAEGAYATGGRLNATQIHHKYREELKFPSLKDSWKRTEAVTPFWLFMEQDTSSYFMNETTAEELRKFLKQPNDPEVEIVLDLPETIAGIPTWQNENPIDRDIIQSLSASLVFRELPRVLALVDRGRIKITEKTKLPTAGSVKSISEVLAEPDFLVESPEKGATKCGPVRAASWGRLVRACGWARAKAGNLVLTKAGKAAMTAPSPDHMKEAAYALCSDDAFDELNRIDHIRGQSGKAKQDMSPPGQRRKSLMDGISQWPLGEWIEMHEAFRYLSSTGNVTSVCADAWNLYFCEKQYGSLAYSGYEGDLDRQYVRVFLFETMATLGLIDIAYIYPHHLWPEFGGSWGTDDLPFCGRYDGLLYVRLNALGAYSLGVTQEYLAEAVEQPSIFRVLPDFDVVVNAPKLTELERCHLEVFARPVSGNVWKLDRGVVIKELERGTSLEEIRAAVRAQNEGDLPGTVEQFFDDLIESTCALERGERAITVNVSSSEIAARIVADTAAGKLCHLAGDQVLFVPEKRESAFRAAVRKMGYVFPL